MCSKPFRSQGTEFGCGQCLPCRFNRRRLWTLRLMLEESLHESSFFVTLTYRKEDLPADGSVSVREAQLFLKRLRNRVAPVGFRYFIVGEYGDSTWRPHYHACLFGLRDALAVTHAWEKGFVQVLPLTYELAQYCVGYVAKKMTRKDDERLGGRAPEFARMSLRPGLGARAAEAIRDSMIDQETGEIRMDVDVPTSLRVGGKLWPLGRYIRRCLRRSLGMAPGQPLVAGNVMKWLEREKFPTWRDRDAREQKRVVHAARARARASIDRSKRGL